MNDRDTRAAILEAQTLAFVQVLDAQGGNVIKEPTDLENRTISGRPTHLTGPSLT